MYIQLHTLTIKKHTELFVMSGPYVTNTTCAHVCECQLSFYYTL